MCETRRMYVKTKSGRMGAWLQVKGGMFKSVGDEVRQERVEMGAINQ